jgi:Mrp family chromosome partitioning ATPase
MSKNFELLSQLGEKFNLTEALPVDAAPKVAARFRAKAPEETGLDEEMKLVQRLFLATGEDAPKVVVFCGLENRDGTSALCARVSEILASGATEPVCLIDADLSSPSLHKRYEVENQLGLADAIFDHGAAKNFVQQVGNGNLWFLPAGSRSVAKQVILSPERFRLQIPGLREQFGYVLISAPPIALQSDAILLGQLADGVILVLKANSSRRATAMKVKESLEASKVRVLGAVLSDRTFPIPDAIYRKV